MAGVPRPDPLHVRSSCALVGVACALGMLGGFGCGDASPTEATREKASAIVFGERSPSPSGDDAVLLLRTEAAGTELLCTATLIAANLVVTARHCVSYSIPGSFLCTVEGELVDDPSRAGTLWGHFPAESLEFYGGEYPDAMPRARGQTTLSTFSPTDRPLDLPVAPLRLTSTTRKGEPLTLIGYGVDESGNPDWHTRPRRKTLHHRIDDLGPDSIDEGVTTVKPRTIVLNGPSACPGDSGGPAFSEITGGLVGVDSLGRGSLCTSPTIVHYYTHVPPFRVLIDEAFAAAKARPRPEKPLLGIDEPCQDGFACETGICIRGSDRTMRCASACGEVMNCPGGYECRPFDSDAGALSACVAVLAADAGDAPSAPSSSDGCAVVASKAVSRGGNGPLFELVTVFLAFARVRRARRTSPRAPPTRNSTWSSWSS